MKLDTGNFQYLGVILGGFFSGEISVLQQSWVSFWRSILGVYSGIFALHVQYHISNEEIDNTKQKTVFYALCVLYVLSVAVITLETGLFVVLKFVRNNAVFFPTLC